MTDTHEPSSFFTRRYFLKCGTGAAFASCYPASAYFAQTAHTGNTLEVLPVGSSPPALPVEHFPTRVHAFIWRNWQLVPIQKLGEVLSVNVEEVQSLARAMGLGDAPDLPVLIRERSALSVIRRNWHLLPYAQLTQLLGWSDEKLLFTLKEDDFLYHKLGLLKPKCETLTWISRTDEIKSRESWMRMTMTKYFGDKSPLGRESLFSFVDALSKIDETTQASRAIQSDREQPLRLCYSYFALYGDPLLEPHLDPYPDGYLQKLGEQGVNAVWLQGVLSQLAEFPWQPDKSAGRETRIANLRNLVNRAKTYGIKIYLYLNEPRSLPLEFFQKHPDLQGVQLDDHAALCTSHAAVKKWLKDGVQQICEQVPELGGFFTITASENPTNCWSHGKGAGCPRCSSRSAADVIAEVNAMFMSGIEKAGHGQQLLVWDWGWKDEWAMEAIEKLPKQCALMSVSEWSLPIERGGVESKVGEYCLSAVGPGPRAKRHWALARRRGIKVIAKIQAALTWEFSAAPYLPVLENVNKHAVNLKDEGVQDIMLSWTLGGHPSPNFAAVNTPLDELALKSCPEKPELLLKFWQNLSQAFAHFPYHIGVVYNAPLQAGPANLLWSKPTEYKATMVGFGYDDLARWRAIYPEDVFISQLEKCASGFHTAILEFRSQLNNNNVEVEVEPEVHEQIRFAEVAALHWESVALQARLIINRQKSQAQQEKVTSLKREIEIAVRLHHLQSEDSRIGFEASNQYYYVPMDLVEKVFNCQALLDDALLDH